MRVNDPHLVVLSRPYLGDGKKYQKCVINMNVFLTGKQLEYRLPQNPKPQNI